MEFIEKYWHYVFFVCISLIIFGSVQTTTLMHTDTPDIVDSYNTLTGPAYQCHKGSKGKVCEVEFPQTLDEDANYKPLYGLLNGMTSNDTVYFHLSGDGGDFGVIAPTIHAIQSSKATTIALVEGPVFSGHADLAMSTKYIKISPNVMFLFHRVSMYGDRPLCELQHGKVDRTQDAEAKCYNFYDNYIIMDGRFSTQLLGNVLTQDQMAALMAGHDIILQGDVVSHQLANSGRLIS